jgi:hypothetical protein
MDEGKYDGTGYKQARFYQSIPGSDLIRQLNAEFSSL